jgi:DNA-binding CsgD family transcriptional regulator
VLLHPGCTRHAGLWTATCQAAIPVGCPENIGKILSDVPAGGHLTTTRAAWARSLACALFGGKATSREYAILPFSEGPQWTGFLGWELSGRPGLLHDLQSNLAIIRRIFRGSHAVMKARVEAEALRWVLVRSDRRVAVAHADGKILGASLPGGDLLKAIEFGERHYFRPDMPTLPAALVEKFDQNPTGQQKLNGHCSARYDTLDVAGREWMPLVGLEFFVEGDVPRASLSRLTPVERDVYERLCVGATTREIAAARGTSPSTIKNQISEILSKSGARRRTELIARASRLEATVTGLSSAHQGAPFISR